MLIKNQNSPVSGYRQIVAIDDPKQPAFMEFGVITLSEGESYTSSGDKERAILLEEGEVSFAFEGKRETAKRTSFLDENPTCLHLPKGASATITAAGPSELVCVSVFNDTLFDAKLYKAEECRTDAYGKGIIKEQSLRYVRTVFENSVAPYSNLSLGEVVNFPGKWSSYPPHHHQQPEVYYYRIKPSQGFALGCEGDDAYVLHDRDTLLIKGDAVHPQTAAPGYAMCYFWVIPNTPAVWKGERSSFEKDAWLLDKDAVIWPDK